MKNLEENRMYQLHQKMKKYLEEPIDECWNPQRLSLLTEVIAYELIAIEQSYKVASFEQIEELYAEHGDNLFEAHLELFKKLFKTIMSYEDK